MAQGPLVVELLSKLASNFDSLNISNLECRLSNIIRDGGSTALHTAYTVDTIDTVYTELRFVKTIATVMTTTAPAVLKKYFFGHL